MKTVGLTGGIGSGKTIVSKIFTILGIPVYYADNRAKELTNSEDEIIFNLKKLFGEEIYTNHMLNRKKLANIIFNDKNKLNKVNNIIHPVVLQDFKKWIFSQTSNYIIKEAAILFESNTYKDLDHIITVSAPESIRIERVMKRDNVSNKEVNDRIKNQLTDNVRIKMSDFVIFNDGKELVIPQILNIHEKLSLV